MRQIIFTPAIYKINLQTIKIKRLKIKNALDIDNTNVTTIINNYSTNAPWIWDET